MQWIDDYQLVLFDLDGLLVNTEELHFRAYVTMCRAHGYELPWSFPEYYQIAAQDAEAPRRAIYGLFPDLQRAYPDWAVLYAEKKAAFQQLLHAEQVPLLPGVEQLLRYLEERQVRRAVVTHSPKPFVELLQQKQPILATVPHWYTREAYAQPKPAPDGYLRAIEELAHPGDRIVGFEDSPRGMQALLATPAQAVLVNGFDGQTRARFESQGVQVFRSFEDI